MLVKLHAQRYFVRQTSEDLFHTHTVLFSYLPFTSAVSLTPPFAPLRSMPRLQCPVLGCSSWNNSWGKKSYPLPSADSFTLQLEARIDVSLNNRICAPCWKRHRDHTMGLDGRTRAVPTVASSHSTHSYLQSSTLFPPPTPLFSLLLPWPLCPLLLLRQPASSLPSSLVSSSPPYPAL